MIAFVICTERPLLHLADGNGRPSKYPFAEKYVLKCMFVPRNQCVNTALCVGIFAVACASEICALTPHLQPPGLPNHPTTSPKTATVLH